MKDSIDNNTPDLFAEPEGLPDAHSDVALEEPAQPPVPPIITDEPNGEEPDEELAAYAKSAYLAYAMAVSKSRAIPDVRDGQKPVQRRILFAMREMGNEWDKPHKKSARIVGDVIGKYHPHGDSAVYEAAVRMAQDFSLRYPLIDGQGNFGSLDGDSAAAMRYTEIRLTPIAELLLSELDQGTVSFRQNYDGSFQEPTVLPARLPFLLLNGASGIGVGIATEVPSHNLREVCEVAAQMVETPSFTEAQMLDMIPGPDFPGGGQILSSDQDIRNAYTSGRGSIAVRARYIFEEMARGQWQMVITELPPGASAAKVLSEIETLTNPQPKMGKKTIDQGQTQTKTLLLSLLDTARDESDKEQSVRIVFGPKSSRIDRDEFARTLLAYTSLETTVSFNLVQVGLDGNPMQKSLFTILTEWCQFRVATVEKRLKFRLGKVNDRIHILEGRHIVFLNIDEVIRIIRQSDEPKSALIERFALSDRQADDILEIRLRQLSRLEGIKIEQEIAELMKERTKLEAILASPAKMRTLVAKEIREDTKKFGDDRRTLIQTEKRASLSEAAVLDEPVTIILSEKGWLRQRQGHGIDIATLSFKEGDKLFASIECRSPDSLILLSSDGRSFTLIASQIPGGKGDGVPAPSVVGIQAGTSIVSIMTGQPEDRVLLSNSGGYGFVTKISEMLTRQKAGKLLMTLEEGEKVLPPVLLPSGSLELQRYVACVSSSDKLLVFPLGEVKEIPKGRGVILMGLSNQESLKLVCVFEDLLTAKGVRRGRSIEEAPLFEIGKRARKGSLLNLKVEGLYATTVSK
ncbi:DNA topoisomerase IV subunit A [Sulfurirhabdus autotrophica]|uniref:DNA topoisomerase 4 subunit A n=2 Tax=Sulfurirhabdus autotrophica TaxID=1706046 RepID=A0A4V2W1A4_9PROT|nr:DNA topoisomerase IV subunit A [Sulfurirhabdus autotrophica]TCV83389.1 DNA topoisomerase IV subunit A [Sulfurirhabdus autotrophica]